MQLIVFKLRNYFIFIHDDDAVNSFSSLSKLNNFYPQFLLCNYYI